MGKRYLIDTNVVSNFVRGLYSPQILTFLNVLLEAQEASLSFVSQIELSAYNPQTSNPEIVAYKNSIANFLSLVPILLIDEAIITETIRIRKTTRVKLPDCLIGATAITHGYTLISSNASDFEKMESLGLSYLNPEGI